MVMHILCSCVFLCARGLPLLALIFVFFSAATGVLCSGEAAAWLRDPFWEPPHRPAAGHTVGPVPKVAKELGGQLRVCPAHYARWVRQVLLKFRYTFSLHVLC